jgi:hypothetical protein
MTMNGLNLIAQGAKYILTLRMQGAGDTRRSTRTEVEYLLSVLTKAFREAARAH